MIYLLDANVLLRERETPVVTEYFKAAGLLEYLAELGFPAGSELGSAAYQAVCSPYRNPLDRHERLAIKAGFSRPFTALMGAMASAAGMASAIQTPA